MDLPLLFPFVTVLLGFRSCSANPLVDCSSSSLPLHCLGRLALSHKNGELFHPYHATHLALNYCPSAEKGPRNSEYLEAVKIVPKKKKKKQVPSKDAAGKMSRMTMQKHSNLCHAEFGYQTPMEDR